MTPASLVLRCQVAPVDRTSQGGDLVTLCLPLQAWAGLPGRPSSSSIFFWSVGSYLVPAPTQDSSAPAQVCLDLILTAALLTVTDVCLCVVRLLSGFGSSGFPGVVWPEHAYLGCLPPSLMQRSLQDGCHWSPFSTWWCWLSFQPFQLGFLPTILKVDFGPSSELPQFLVHSSGMVFVPLCICLLFSSMLPLQVRELQPGRNCASFILEPLVPVKSWAYQRPSDPPQEAGVLPGTAVLFMSVNALTGLDAANRDMRVGRRLRGLETQKMWLLIQKTLDKSLLWNAASSIYEMKGFP